MMRDRRVRSERRERHLIPEPLERKKERREDERRDSPRRLIALDVREPGKKSRSCMGDLSVEGAAFVTTTPPAGDVVELMFSVPTYVGPIVTRGQVVGRHGLRTGVQVSAVFPDIDAEAQLAIAEWLQPSLRKLSPPGVEPVPALCPEEAPPRR
ncbi:MAG: PilZ domain-containing protein [Myxococcales bacterium]|nr:PilZ domain-containing protein [Myxococcales bacterium]